MKRFFWTIYLILSHLLLNAQGIPGLLKQSTDYIQKIPGDTSSWQYSTRQTYGYNSNNQKVYENHKVWDDQAETWDLTYETKRRYDMAGNRIYFWSINYDSEGSPTMEWESFRKYKGNLRIESHIFLTNHEEDQREEMLIEYEFDEEDRLTETVTEFWSNTNIHWKRINSTYYNSDGCEVARVEKETEYFLDHSYDIIDSTHVEYVGDCIVKQIDLYVYIQERQEFYNTVSYKIDYEFNSRNQIIQELHYQKSPDEPQWSPLSLYEYEKNNNDQILNYHFINLRTNFEKMETYRYDQAGNVIYHTEQEWDQANNNWINNFEYSAEYRSDSLLENYEYLYGWDKLLGDYRYYVASDWEYDLNNNLIRETQEILDVNRNNQENYFITRQWDFENRCDGVLLSVEVRDITSINAPNIFTPEKTVHEYYNHAGCDPALSEEQSWVVYPNPSRGELNVYANHIIGMAKIELINAMGQQVYEEERDLNNYFSVNTFDLPSGIYTLRINNGTSQVSERITLIR